MNSCLFADCINRFDRKMRLAGRNVVLLLDTAPSFPREMKLKRDSGVSTG